MLCDRGSKDRLSIKSLFQQLCEQPEIEVLRSSYNCLSSKTILHGADFNERSKAYLSMRVDRV